MPQRIAILFVVKFKTLLFQSLISIIYIAKSDSARLKKKYFSDYGKKGFLMSTGLRGNKQVASLEVELALLAENKGLKKALQANEFLGTISVQLSHFGDPKSICSFITSFLAKHKGTKQVIVSHIGEHQIYCLRSFGQEVFDDQLFMQNIKHGKINYQHKIQFWDMASTPREKIFFSNTFELMVEDSNRFILLNFEDKRKDFYSFVIELDQTGLESDIISLTRLHQIIQVNLERSHHIYSLEKKLSSLSDFTSLSIVSDQ